MQSHKRKKNGTTAAAIWFARRLFAACCCFALLTLPQLAHSFPSGAITTAIDVSLGSGTVIDSFDSADTNYSDWNTNWGYGTYDSAKRKANGNVATDGTGNGAISGGTIYGHADTGPGGTVTTGSVGDLAWVNSGHSGIEPGYSADDMNVTFPAVTLPTNLGNPTLTTASTISASGYYQMNSPGNLTIQGSGSPTAPVNVTIYMPNGLSYSGNNGLNVGTNAHVTIYSGGNISISGDASLNDLTKNALNLQIYGLPGCTSIHLLGNAAFTGTIYAPTADFSFGAGGPNPYDIVGAVVSKSVTLTGHVNVHFDENLARVMTFPICITTPPKNQAVQVGSNATFSVSIYGGSPRGYQWYLNQTNLIASGTNYLSLSLTNVQLTDTGIYSLVAVGTNSPSFFGSVTSAPAILFVYTNSAQLAAQLAAPANPTNGQFQFNIAGVTGFNYAVQVSSNLVNWVSLQTNVVPFGFTDTNVNLAPPPRFYRSVFMP